MYRYYSFETNYRNKIIYILTRMKIKKKNKILKERIYLLDCSFDI